MSLNDSVSSLAGVDSGALGLDLFGSDVLGSEEVIGLDMRSYSVCGVIPHLG